jgi:hypothetical protein
MVEAADHSREKHDDYGEGDGDARPAGPCPPGRRFLPKVSPYAMLPEAAYIQASG